MTTVIERLERAILDANNSDDVYERAAIRELGIKSALAALRNPWRGIEEAPRDGTVVLAWRYHVVAIRWAPEIDSVYPWDAIETGGAFPMSDNGFREGDPALTHYMPLPPAPEQEP